jgi:hypothetical protein
MRYREPSERDEKSVREQRAGKTKSLPLLGQGKSILKN